MELPSFPTDSIYKFIALAGLAFILFAATYPQSKFLDLEIAIAEAESLSEKLSANIENTERKLTNLKTLESTDIKTMEVISELTLKNRHDNAELQLANKIVNTKLEALNYYIRLAKISLILGTLMAIIGFGFWHIKIQLPLDQAMNKALKRHDSSP